MSADEAQYKITAAEATELATRAATAFRPRTPINHREFFAGRWGQVTTVSDAVAQTGVHIVIFGERGVGKTSLANVIDPLLQWMDEKTAAQGVPRRLVVKVNAASEDTFAVIWKRALDEITVVDNTPRIGFDRTGTQKRILLREAWSIGDNPSIDDIRRVLGALTRSVFIFDEFDRTPPEVKQAFTDLIKVLSDYAVDVTIVIVGVSTTVDDLVRGHASISRSVVQVQLPRMNRDELQDILQKASAALNVVFAQEAEYLIVHVSQGLPHYTHLIGLHSVRAATQRLSRLINSDDVIASFGKAVEQAIQSIREKYLLAIRSSRKDALYAQVVLACASAAFTCRDELGYFHPADVMRPMSIILKRPRVTIATFRQHLNDFCEIDHGPVLERIGSPHSYSYRFCDPLLPPFIFMNAMSSGIIDAAGLEILTSIPQPN